MIRSTVVVALALLLAPALAEACAVCYGARDSAMTTGLNNGILTLGVATLKVKGDHQKRYQQRYTHGDSGHQRHIFRRRPFGVPPAARERRIRIGQHAC